jgi:hypothetical protein
MKKHTMHLRLFAAKPTRKPNAAANSVDAQVRRQAKKHKRMKNIVYILLFLTNLTYGQTIKLTETGIEKYAKSVDKLRAENKLVKVVYPNMSGCGGGVDGYYLNKTWF